MPLRAQAAAIATIPTGFSGVPPVGPATPVTPTATSVPAMRTMPLAIASATGSLTAPCAAINEAGTPSRSVFDWLLYTTTPRSTYVGASRHFGQSRHHEPAGARLCRGNPEAARTQQLADHLLHRLAVGAEEIAAERRAHIGDRSVERAMPLIGTRRHRGQMQLDLSERGENRRGDSRRRRQPFRVQRLHLLFDVRFALAGDAQQPPEQPRGADVPEQSLLDDDLEHRLQLARRAGQQHDQLADRARSRGPAPFRSCSAAPPRLRHHRLTPVDLRRPQAARGKALSRSPRRCSA